jgi:glycosyltransferase involved in cell wall biosynthesis
MITFIIPTIGRETLPRTLQSLLRQTDPEWNAIVVVDGVRVPRTLPKDYRITVLPLGQKLGQHYNSAGNVRNAGMEKAFAQGNPSWFAFVDDDDTVTKDYVATLKNAIHNHPDGEVFIFRMVNTNGQILPPPGAHQFMLHQVGISFAMKASLFRHGFRFIPSSGEDFMLLDAFRRAKRKIYMLPNIVYHVRC